jgi:hypothetical protein
MRWIYTVIGIALVAWCMTRCATAPQKAAIIEQEHTNTQAKEMVERSNLTPQEKSFISAALDGSLTIAKKAEQRGDEQQARADGLAKYKALVWWAVGAIGAVLVGLYLKKRFLG